MNKTILGLIAVAVLLGALLWLYPVERATTDLAVRALSYCEQEHVAGVEISRSAGLIKVISSLLGGGATYYPEDGGQPLECPVVGPDAMSEECRAIQEVSDWEEVCSPRVSHEEAERVAFTFIQDVIAVAPPNVDTEAEARLYDALSSAAREEVSYEMLLPDIARFVGIQDVPDQGASVEDLQIVSEREAYLVVGLNYSGGRVLRTIHLVDEDGVWKVDRVSAPENSESQFEAEGNLVRNNPGMQADAWHLVYEEPGAPALTVRLEFDSSSVCAEGAENATCDPEELESGQRVKVLGEYVGEEVVRIVRLEMR